ncbi:zinc finger MYND domain-containing protein 12 isoform X2 [Kryptolebias marmoratus]|uniref:zinc finger MYND domain-containing protein 12 isoform X2 n=1 Tax=Kryptolebias marmoratus TaxID=37003 RepID=UPI000D52F889|nr:zinc finger MYND domain-containing protein 12 isoform X2 [Kryptolebias marmoratus]
MDGVNHCSQSRGAHSHLFGAEHQQADWVGIHERICQLLVPIRTPAALQQDSCMENQRKKAELIEICSLVAQSKLSEGKHQETLPAAQFCLRCSIDVHGRSSVQLVPAFLLLAEANMGLGNFTLVEELLSQAEWAVLKSPECGHSVHHRLHRSMGRFHAATGNLETARLHFANDIYFASEEYGLDSTVTCRGYFLLAGVFVKQGKRPVARSLYSEVGRTWHCHLTELFKNCMQDIRRPANLSNSFSVDRSQRAEVDEMLRAMLEFEQSDPRKDSAQIALLAHCLAMLWFLGGDSVKALGFGCTALQTSQLIPNHDLTESVRILLQLVQPETDQQAGLD